MNKKILLLIIIVLAVSVIGTVILNLYLASTPQPAKGALVLQSDVAGVTVTIFGPENIFETGVIGESGEFTFTSLPEGDYQVIATKEGYTPHVMGTNINYALYGGRNTVQIYMMPIPSEVPVYLSTNPNAIIVEQGSSGTVRITVTSQGDYAGTVSLNCTHLPQGVTATFNPEVVTLTKGGSASSILTLTVSSTAAEGVYEIDIDLTLEHLTTGGLGLLLKIS